MENMTDKELEPIKAELETMRGAIPAVIKTQAEAEKAGELGKLIKDAKNRITDFFEPKKKRARAAWQDWLDAEKAELAPWEELDGAVRKALGDFARIEEQKRREAVEAARKKAEAQAEKKTEKTGVYVAPAPVADAPKVSTSTAKFREDWKFEIVDASQVPEMFKIIDEKALGAFVRSKKGAANVAGVRVYSVQTPVI